MIECTKFTSYEKGTLQGYANFYIESWDFEINGCSLHMKDGKRWINLPSEKYVNSDGEEKYSPVNRIRCQKKYNNFCDQAKKAIDLFCS